MRVNQPTNSPVQSPSTSGAGATDSTKKLERPSQALTAAKAEAAQPKTTIEGSAQSEISGKAKEFARAKGVAEQAPDVREEKIAALKKKIADGSYSVDAQAVANRLVDDHLSAKIG